MDRWRFLLPFKVWAGTPPTLTPPHKGEGVVLVGQTRHRQLWGRQRLRSPSPLWGGVRGGGTNNARSAATNTPLTSIQAGAH